jgi:hypothetical protein
MTCGLAMAAKDLARSMTKLASIEIGSGLIFPTPQDIKIERRG